MLYSEMFPLGKDNTDYKKIDGDFVSSSSINGRDTLIVSSDKNEWLSKPATIIRKLSDLQIQCKAVSSLKVGLEIIKSLVNKSPSIGLIFGSHYVAKEVFQSFEI